MTDATGTTSGPAPIPPDDPRRQLALAPGRRREPAPHRGEGPATRPVVQIRASGAVSKAAGQSLEPWTEILFTKPPGRGVPRTSP